MFANPVEDNCNDILSGVAVKAKRWSLHGNLQAPLDTHQDRVQEVVYFEGRCLQLGPCSTQSFVDRGTAAGVWDGVVAYDGCCWGGSHRGATRSAGVGAGCNPRHGGVRRVVCSTSSR